MDKKVPLKKIIYFHDDDCHYEISTENFEKLLLKNGSFVSDEAKHIDEQIFCYVPNDIFNSSEEQICDFIRKNIL
ncbi:MAG TPA: hypothetical protein DCW73_00345 [Treponema sp.]|nr:hypothetical protein [Treponema sp.]